MDESELTLIAAAVIFSYLFQSLGKHFLSFGSKAWEKAAAQTKLDFSGGLMAGKKLLGNLQGFEVQVFELKAGKFRPEVVAEVQSIDPGFVMAPEPSLLGMIVGDIETGDPDFDQRVRITGNEESALALLDHKVRRAAARVVADYEGELEGQTIRVSMESIDRLKPRLDAMLGLARLLRRPSSGEILDLLAHQALRDKSGGVRLRAFRQLITSESGCQKAYPIAEKLLSAGDSTLRLEAARLLLEGSGQGQAAAKALAKLASGRGGDRSSRISALEILTKPRTLPDALPVMAKILRRPDDDWGVRRKALEGLIEAREAAALLAVRPEGFVETELLARGLGHLDAAAQPRLLELLGHSEDRVREAAAASLGRVGELSAIRALHELAGTDRFKSGSERAASEAIYKIRTRSAASQGGELSIATLEPLEGAVSLDDDEVAGGEVSLTK